MSQCIKLKKLPANEFFIKSEKRNPPITFTQLLFSNRDKIDSVNTDIERSNMIRTYRKYLESCNAEREE